MAMRPTMARVQIHQTAKPGYMERIKIGFNSTNHAHTHQATRTYPKTNNSTPQTLDANTCYLIYNRIPSKSQKEHILFPGPPSPMRRARLSHPWRFPLDTPATIEHLPVIPTNCHRPPPAITTKQWIIVLQKYSEILIVVTQLTRNPRVWFVTGQITESGRYPEQRLDIHSRSISTWHLHFLCERCYESARLPSPGLVKPFSVREVDPLANALSDESPNEDCGTRSAIQYGPIKAIILGDEQSRIGVTTTQYCNQIVYYA